MINVRASQFKLVLIFAITLAVALGVYVVWVIVEFNSDHAFSESQFLSKYTERAISRYRVNPAKFAALPEAELTTLLGSNHINVAFNYAQLQNRFAFVPPERKFKLNTAKAILVNYQGLLRTPNYLLVLPTPVDAGKVFYSYLWVDSRVKDVNLNFRILEKIQPAIFIALISIFLLIVLELFHISKMNTNINHFADWASQLSAGVSSPSIPEFSSSKFNYMAFTIDKNLSGISQMLEQEQSFAKFTSHELRTPIAVLSANMEVLELIMKDLSPQERKVLKNMESAVSDMRYQMEALLWLSREGEAVVDYATCLLSEFITKAIQDNAYLTEGKNIVTHLVGGDNGGSIKTNPVFLQIVLNNLLRNAYQNTEEGSVNIELTQNTLVIENIAALPMPNKNPSGFGIGLVLVDKLVHKLDIDYHVEKLPNGRRVRLTF